VFDGKAEAIVAILSTQPVIAWTFVTGPTVSIDGKTGDLVVSWHSVLQYWLLYKEW
jgi:hypothetical protein